MRALVVEDHPDISMLYNRMLLEYEIVNTPDGESAIKKLEKEPFDLVILDMHLGTVSGIEVLSFLRSRTQFDDTLILAISADDSLKKVARSYGVDFWMTKPIDIDRLLSYLKTVQRTQVK